MSNKCEFIQPNAIILNIYGVITSFEKHLIHLRNYFKNNLENYLHKNYEDKKIVRLIKRIIKEEKIEADFYKTCSIFTDQTIDKNEIVLKISKYLLKHYDSENLPNSPICLLQDWIWADGFCSEKWRMDLFIKLFSLSEADISGQKLFFKSTELGDLTKYFNNYIQYVEENRTNTDFYKNLAKVLRDTPSNLLFISSELNDVLAASKSGLNCILIKEKQENNLCLKNVFVTDSIENIKFTETFKKNFDCC